MRPLPLSRATTLGRLGSSAKVWTGNALLFEDLLEVVGGGLLVAGRVARVHAHQRLEMTHRLLLDASPIRARRLLPLHGNGDEKERGNEDDVVAHHVTHNVRSIATLLGPEQMLNKE